MEGEADARDVGIAAEGVIRLRYGINGDEPTPLRETSRRLELKQSEVKTLEERGLSRLAQAREVEAMNEAA